MFVYMSKKLTLRQEAILECIKNQISKNGYPPSVREIAKTVGLRSSSTVHEHLKSLEKKGYIRRIPSQPRAIEILDESFILNNNKNLTFVTLVGDIAAGKPLLAVENKEERYPFPRELLGEGELFMLKIKGDSMIEAGILDGDYVIVHRQPTAENGEIVAALLDNEATVKKFYKKNGYYVLKPANSYFEPIITKEVDVLGKVIGLFRRF